MWGWQEGISNKGEDMTPCVSIIMPSYNDGKFIEQSINSIIKQNYQNWQLIVVLDGCTDNTEQILREKYSKDSRVRYLKQLKNMGIGASINAGYSISTGELITIASSDCWYEPTWLFDLVDVLCKHQEVEFVYANTSALQMDGKIYPLYNNNEYSKDRLLKECYIGIAYMYRRSLKDKVGLYDERPCEDYDMFLRMSEHTDFFYINKQLAFWRNHKDNLTNRHSVPTNWADSDRCKKDAKKRRDIKIEKPLPKVEIIKKDSKVKVAHIHPWWDSASVGMYFTELMNGMTNIHIRHILGGKTNLTSKIDLFLPTQKEEVIKVLEWADILHFNTFWLSDVNRKAYYLPQFDWEKYTKNKKLIFHLHGGEWSFRAEELETLHHKGVEILSCSPLVADIYKFVKWMVNPIPINNSLYLPISRNNDPMRFLFLANYLYNKGKDAVDMVFEWLLKDGYKLDYEAWINRYSPEDCLNNRKMFDVCIDNMAQGFIGMVGWETLCQEQVCLARLDPVVAEAYKEFGNGTPPPIINCRGVDELAKNTIWLLNHPQQVKDIKKEGRKWMEKYYSPERICDMWGKYYESLV